MVRTLLLLAQFNFRSVWLTPEEAPLEHDYSIKPRMKPGSASWGLGPFFSLPIASRPAAQTGRAMARVDEVGGLLQLISIGLHLAAAGYSAEVHRRSTRDA